ncbi:bifunctional aminoglycoside phosphotransferase/ATP-binding protein [Nocardia shimofusensis]|uniref:bifunctional aminoglycoside phosphotransferase/ATP-binding protein n=1 Tax=Nocardia shimofusensis TaxID=228596 RepID=UPI000A56EB07|nr:bifunctional aminoglycoside phosphotransferase/ATP-binding protein [Nocardia shimofusensis]
MPQLPEGEPYVQVRETHTGVVMLCGDRAYKAKKPIVTDFLDFGTPAARERACARELELNQRLAPDVYLGLAHVTDPAGGPAEPLLVMRRMSAAMRLSAVLADPSRRPSPLPDLAATVARFHLAARRATEIDEAARPERLRRRWRSLLDPLADHPCPGVDPAVLARIDALAMRYIDGRSPLFDERIAAGRIIDGHGDMLAEDIFVLPDGFRILDCLDFDDQLRYVDALDDAAFLAMDLEFLGHPQHARSFLDDYADAARDPAPVTLRHHYIAYRATVRAKTDRVRYDQNDPAAAGNARRHLDLAVRHLEQGAVRLVLVGGLPGTGKSTVATQLAAGTDAVVLSSDEVRDRMRAAGALTGDSGTFGAGAYAPAAKTAVYTTLLELARERLEHGVSVILDASWTDPAERDRAAALADQTCSELVSLHCTCPAELAHQRIETRTRGYSEATPAIADALAATAAPWPEATRVDTAQPLEDSLALALRAWQDPMCQQRTVRQR